ncbi:mercuric transporter MerT family protein [Methylomonas sp. SURF-1]|uniref:Mercuric transport protein MerT n=2 Tax=Methylomonas TaxID=416 RepID=A0ABU4UBV6_9GAMM|nr:MULTISPECIES: mercuric transporter MerT family protein [unclassified Methylomonas]MCQ8183304.1 mercuric transporter MerT family protein [Methylomonas sp. SURF-1]MDX8126937.1 mercuric transporter MerT family protein [Methylomonas sp. OY6]
MNTDPETSLKTPSWLGIGALLAAVGASACCVGPFLLLSLGIGGAWISALTAMEPARPFFIVMALIFIVLGYRKLYLTSDRCNAGEICATSDNQQRQRRLFWLGSAFILILLAFPWLAPFFMT